MKKIAFFFSLLLVVLLWAGPAFAAEYYYVIVTRPEWRTAVEPIRALRSYDADHQARVVTLDEIPAVLPGQPTWQEIKAYFQNTLYPQEPAGWGTEYIFLVGGYTKIPLINPVMNGSLVISATSDQFYTSFFAGPEIAIGRLPANTVTDIENYYQKILPGGSGGFLIPSGEDRINMFIECYGGDNFYTADEVRRIVSPYLEVGTTCCTLTDFQLRDVVGQSSIHMNTSHGYGCGMNRYAYANLNTTMSPFYHAFGCSSAAFWSGVNDDPRVTYINHRTYYSAIAGKGEPHSDSDFAKRFVRTFMQYGYPSIGDIHRFAGQDILLGDPYLKLTSQDFLESPRIYVDRNLLSGQRNYNLDTGTGQLDPLRISVQSFNGCQWAVGPVSFSAPELGSYVSVSPLSGNADGEITVSFLPPDGLPAGTYSISFDIKDVSSGDVVYGTANASLVVSDTNYLETSDFIINGNTMTLPPGYYVMSMDLIIPAGTTLVLQPGVTVLSDFYGGKISIQPGGRLVAKGTVDNPVRFSPPPNDWRFSSVQLEINADGDELAADFEYCYINSKIVGIGTPRLQFKNCTIMYAMMMEGVFPNPVKGRMSNTIVGRGQMGQPTNGGYLSNMDVSYSLVPASFKGTGPGIVWDREFVDNESKLINTSLCVNGGDPADSPDPDGTIRDIGASYFPLFDIVRVPQDYPTIQQAIDVAKNTTTKVVRVDSGTYQENLTLPVGVRLMGNPAQSKPVILDPDGTDTLVSIVQEGFPGPSAVSLIEHMILTKKGQAFSGKVLHAAPDFIAVLLRDVEIIDSDDNAAAISVPGMGSQIGFVDLKLSGNDRNGSLIEFSLRNGNYQSWIKDSLFENNTNNNYLVKLDVDSWMGNLILNNALIRNNSGGKLFANTSVVQRMDNGSDISTLLIERSILSDNNATEIMAAQYGYTRIDSSVLANNGTSNPLVIRSNDNSVSEFHNSIVWNNTLTFSTAPGATVKASYNDINSSHPGVGAGNINAAPLFVDMANGDFHIERNSPCVNTGDPLSAVPLNGGTAIDMGKHEVPQDLTPPSVPVVTDSGDQTHSATQLSAQWHSEDLDTGVAEYQYQIRSAAVDGPIVRDWTPVTAEAVSAMDLNLTAGQIYFFCVKAKNQAEVWSGTGYSDGIQYVNQAPVLNTIGNKTVNEGQTLNFSVYASDPDGDTVTYSASGLPSGAVFNSSSGAFSWTPNSNQAGNYPVTIAATDGTLTDSENITITVNDIPSVDLILTALSTTTANVAKGSYLSLSNTVKNQGTSAAAAFVIEFHLSADNTYGGSDDVVLTPTRSVSSLAAGASSGTSTSVLIPATAVEGAYFLCAKADSGAVVNESAEDNNTRCTATPVQVSSADLVMNTLGNPPASFQSGTYMIMSSSVKNQGTGTSSSFYVGYYLSDDAVITTSDRYLGNAYISSLGGGAIANQSPSILIPATIPAGNYYLGAIADYNNTRPESNEANNMAASVTQVSLSSGVDLAITAFQAPTSYVSGTTMSFTDTVKNQGPGRTGTFYVAYYLSADANITTSDTYLGRRSVSVLLPDATSTATTTLSNIVVTPGTYYVGAIADYNNGQAESNETNNLSAVLSMPVTPGEDMVMTTVGGPAGAVTGGPLTLTDTVKNQGPGKGGSFYVGLYLSSDAIITTSDTRVGSRSVSALNSQASSSGSTTVTLSTTLSPGTYYIGVLADYSNARVEQDESNNALAGPQIVITPGPDLVVSSVSGPATGTRGSSIAINDSVRNQGSGNCSSFYVAYYLSTDVVINTSDRYLGRRSVSSLNVGQTSSATTSVTLSTSIPVGTYYIGAIVDYLNSRPEQNETNNSLAGNPITIN